MIDPSAIRERFAVVGRGLNEKVHDFVDAELGKVVPYGVYDIAANASCVSVGIGWCVMPMTS